VSDVKVPQGLTDLYADLRERHLLPVVALLVVALFAVPLLLGGGSEEASPPPPVPGAVAGDSGSARLEPAVLVEEPTVRDYRERLEAFKERNPFEQQFVSSSSTGGGSAEAAPAPDPGAADAGAATSPSGSSGATGSTGGSDGSTGGGGGSGGGDSGGSETKLITYELDLLAGEAGKTKRIRGVRLLEYVPGKQRPLAQFIGTGVDGELNGTKAAFAVSKNVSHGSGDGRCVPSAQSCDFLVLAEGEAQRLDYEPDGRTYRIKLLRIDRIVEDAEGLKGSSQRKRARLAALLDAAG
jgi:hypothetical protein